MSLKSLVISSVAAIALLGPAQAQNAFKIDAPLPAQQPRAAKEVGLKLARPAGEAGAPQAAPVKAVDESALRFYAGQGDTARVAAEIRRLKTLHANWQPPEDLFSVGGPTIDEQPLWALFAAKRYEELRERIAALQAERPEYVPSADLAGKLVQAERREAIVIAADGKDWPRVIELATGAEDLLVCREIDLLWRVAEALSGVEEPARAVDVYRYILTNCENSRERLATVQKASTILPAPTVQELIALGKRRGANAEFDAIGVDIIRRKMGQASSGDTTEMPDARELKLIETSARRGVADDAALLGWYHFGRKDYAAAKEWFGLATKSAPKPKYIEGLILALRNSGDLEQAEELAYRHREADMLIRKAYIEIVASDITGPTAKVLTSERRMRLEEIIAKDKSALGAQALGWSLYNAQSFAPARAWFERSISWAPSEEAVVGLVVAARRLNDRAAALATVNAYKQQYPAVASLDRLGNQDPTSPRSARRIARGGLPSGAMRDSLKLYEAGKFQEAAALLDSNQRSMPVGMQELRAWAHYNATNYKAAGEIFAKLKTIKPSKATEHGDFLVEIQARGNPHRWWYN
ncbi:hypothetical protein WBO78_27075 [Bosea sp. CCNWLW174]|uniref:hypothetical protein n=1 Tax=unclassified Bosea (in: a-proteobacteria) TaxID=2653178 RepID=UPI0030144CFC